MLVCYMDSNAWYKEGLRFQCTGCGKCCTGAPGFVFVSQEEIEEMAKHLGMPVALFKRKYVKNRGNRLLLVEKKNHDCIFLKDNKCSIYQVRPKQCRTYPWWKENLNSEESWRLASKECEGISHEAPIVPYSQIVQFLSENK